MSTYRRKVSSEDGADRLLRELEDHAIDQGARPVDVAILRDRANLSATLLSLRLARGLSQMELSQLSGVEQADISRIEHANVDPRTSTVLRLLAGLDARVTFELEDDTEQEGAARAETHVGDAEVASLRSLALE